VVISKNNFLITLAPYFFPVYVAAVVLVFMVGHLIWVGHATCLFHLLSARVCFSRHLDLANVEDAPVRYYATGIPVLRGGHLAGKRGLLLFGVPLVTRVSAVNRVALVAGVHR